MLVAYKVISRNSFVFRRPTWIYQYTPEESDAKKAEFAQPTMTLVHMNGINEHYFVNIDETAVYFDSSHYYTVNERVAKTVSMRRGSTANKICTVCVTVAADGSKLHLFVILNGTVNGGVAK